MANESLNGLLCRLVDELVSRGVPLEQARKEFERRYALAALERHDGNVTRAAEALGVHRNTLRSKVAPPDAGSRR